MHHLDIHVSDIAATRRLFDRIMPELGLELRSESDDFVSYWRGRRPSIGFILDDKPRGSGSMQPCFGVTTRAQVDRVAELARANGARSVDGPAIHEEYGDDYYAVFFEDADGNAFEVLNDETTS